MKKQGVFLLLLLIIFSLYFTFVKAETYLSTNEIYVGFIEEDGKRIIIISGRPLDQKGVTIYDECVGDDPYHKIWVDSEEDEDWAINPVYYNLEKCDLTKIKEFFSDRYYTEESTEFLKDPSEIFDVVTQLIKERKIKLRRSDWIRIRFYDQPAFQSKYAFKSTLWGSFDFYGGQNNMKIEGFLFPEVLLISSPKAPLFDTAQEIYASNVRFEIKENLYDEGAIKVSALPFSVDPERRGYIFITYENKKVKSNEISIEDYEYIFPIRENSYLSFHLYPSKYFTTSGKGKVVIDEYIKKGEYALNAFDFVIKAKNILINLSTSKERGTNISVKHLTDMPDSKFIVSFDGPAEVNYWRSKEYPKEGIERQGYIESEKSECKYGYMEEDNQNIIKGNYFVMNGDNTEIVEACIGFSEIDFPFFGTAKKIDKNVKALVSFDKDKEQLNITNAFIGLKRKKGDFTYETKLAIKDDGKQKAVLIFKTNTFAPSYASEIKAVPISKKVSSPLLLVDELRIALDREVDIFIDKEKEIEGKYIGIKYATDAEGKVKTIEKETNLESFDLILNSKIDESALEENENKYGIKNNNVKISMLTWNPSDVKNVMIKCKNCKAVAWLTRKEIEINEGNKDYTITFNDLGECPTITAKTYRTLNYYRNKLGGEIKNIINALYERKVNENWNEKYLKERIGKTNLPEEEKTYLLNLLLTGIGYLKGEEVQKYIDTINQLKQKNKEKWRDDIVTVAICCKDEVYSTYVPIFGDVGKNCGGGEISIIKEKTTEKKEIKEEREKGEAPTPTVYTKKCGKDEISYKVKKGDTLFKIMEANGLDYRDEKNFKSVMELNRELKERCFEGKKKVKCNHKALLSGKQWLLIFSGETLCLPKKGKEIKKGNVEVVNVKKKKKGEGKGKGIKFSISGISKKDMCEQKGGTYIEKEKAQDFFQLLRSYTSYGKYEGENNYEMMAKLIIKNLEENYGSLDCKVGLMECTTNAVKESLKEGSMYRILIIIKGDLCIVDLNEIETLQNLYIKDISNLIDWSASLFGLEKAAPPISTSVKNQFPSQETEEGKIFIGEYNNIPLYLKIKKILDFPPFSRKLFAFKPIIIYKNQEFDVLSKAITCKEIENENTLRNYALIILDQSLEFVKDGYDEKENQIINSVTNELNTLLDECKKS